MPTKGKAPLNIRSLARTHTEEAIKTLVAIMKDKKAPESARVQASDKILDRGWGKAPAVLQGDEDGGPIKTQEVGRVEMARRVAFYLRDAANDTEEVERDRA